MKVKRNLFQENVLSFKKKNIKKCKKKKKLKRFFSCKFQFKKLCLAN